MAHFLVCCMMLLFILSGRMRARICVVCCMLLKNLNARSLLFLNNKRVFHSEVSTIETTINVEEMLVDDLLPQQ